MVRSIVLAAAFVGGLLAVAPAQADALLDGLSSMPGSVDDVRIAGTWEQGNQTGAYRVVIARTVGEAVTARLFVQWIGYHDDGSTTVDKTIEIKELANLKIDIVDYTSQSDSDGLSVFIQTLDPNGKSDQNYELFVNSPTDYRFGPASN
jgi:hypothetical protein